MYDADPEKGKAYSRKEYNADPEKRKQLLSKLIVLTLGRRKHTPRKSLLLMHKVYFTTCRNTITSIETNGMHIGVLGML